MNDDDRKALDNLNASPINPLPGAVWLLLAVVLGIEAVLWAGGAGLVGGARAVGWRIAAIESYAYSSAIQHWMIENMRFPLWNLARYGAFSFVHGSPMHALFGAVLLAALGKSVAEQFGALRFLLLALLVPILAAAGFGLIVGNHPLGWLLGAMPMVFGLVGAFTWLKWREAGTDAVKKRRAFGMIALLLGARLAFGLIAEAGPGWIAEALAFAMGFALSALFLGPQSWSRTRDRLRG